jgi:hypothetical protein
MEKIETNAGDLKEQFRVVINRESNECLEQIVAKANVGFSGGEITRTDLANYIFGNVLKLLSDADLKSLRALHFDERKVLGTILKSEAALPEEVRRAVRDHYGVPEPAKKRPMRTMTEPSTAAIVTI